ASTAFVHDHEGERPDRTIDIDGSQEPVVDQLFWAGWSCSVYLPSTVAPVGLLDDLPVGLQIVAPHLHDRRSIHFASLVERELGGFVAPPGYETI
ncbi:MAG TPA: amidase, partial [Acidimicrobiaceae bacterium]|nr:amidase [Acidimicrobiaceae bacterium]